MTVTNQSHRDTLQFLGIILQFDFQQQLLLLATGNRKHMGDILETTGLSEDEWRVGI